MEAKAVIMKVEAADIEVVVEAFNIKWDSKEKKNNQECTKDKEVVAWVKEDKIEAETLVEDYQELTEEEAESGPILIELVEVWAKEDHQHKE